MPKPIFFIYANDVDVTSKFMEAGVVTMTVTDGAGLSADTLQIDIDDIRGSTTRPRTGAILRALGGYEGRLRDFGLFIVDSVTYTGWPQKISIGAKSVAAKYLAKQRDSTSYPKKDFPTYGDVFETVASRVGLTLQMAPELRSLLNPYEAQSEENGLEFLTRLGEKLNAAVTVKAMNLVVVIKGAGRSASGALLDKISVATGRNLLSYSVAEIDEPQYSEVEATYYDRAGNNRQSVGKITGLEGPKFLLRDAYQEADEAERAADAHARALVRMQSEATFAIDGDPFAMAEAWAEVSGCREPVDGLWRVVTVTHSFASDGPYTTALQCEAPSA